MRTAYTLLPLDLATKVTSVALSYLVFLDFFDFLVLPRLPDFPTSDSPLVLLSSAMRTCMRLDPRILASTEPSTEPWPMTGRS